MRQALGKLGLEQQQSPYIAEVLTHAQSWEMADFSAMLSWTINGWSAGTRYTSARFLHGHIDEIRIEPNVHNQPDCGKAQNCFESLPAS